jgi:hypothetical protein
MLANWLNFVSDSVEVEQWGEGGAGGGGGRGGALAGLLSR